MDFSLGVTTFILTANSVENKNSRYTLLAIGATAITLSLFSLFGHRQLVFMNMFVYVRVTSPSSLPGSIE